MNRTEQKFVSPRDAVIVGNSGWSDDATRDIDFTAQVANNTVLAPGETLQAAYIETSPETENKIAVRATATTAHAADIDNDGNAENIVRYRFEVKPERATDRYNPLPGLSTTLPFGQMGSPVEFIPGAFIGPVAALRVVFVNRSDSFSNPTDVPLDDIGAELHARVLREPVVKSMKAQPNSGGER